MFEHSFNTQFRAVTSATSAFQTRHFMLLPSVQFLCLLSHKLRLFSGPWGTIAIEMHPQDHTLFTDLKSSMARIHNALKLFRKRGKTTKKGLQEADIDENGDLPAED